MSDREQYRPKIHRLIMEILAFALLIGSFGFLMLVVGDVSSGRLAVIAVGYLAVIVAAVVVGFRFGRRQGLNTDPDAALGFMGTPWGILAVVLAPGVGLTVAARGGDLGRGVLPLVISTTLWFVWGAGLGNLWWITDGQTQSDGT